jgi:hypothetical protein
MTQARTQRIHRGFHRIGAVLAGIILALGMVVVGVIAVEEANKTSTKHFDISTAKPVTISVRLPNGVIVRNVPHGTTKQQLIRILEDQGYNAFQLQAAGAAPLDYQNFKFDWAQEGGIDEEKDGSTNPIVQPTEKPKWAEAPIVERQSRAGLSYLVAVIANIPAWVLAGFAAVAAAIYSLCRAAGWVLAGFLGD